MSHLAESFLERIKQSLNAIDGDDPAQKETTDKIWHFTSMDGFLGILEKHCFYATNLGYMNDHSELVTGHRHVVGLLLNKLKRHSVSGEVLEHLYKKHIEHWRAPEFNAFATCFCLLAVQLSQWRGYGKGVAVGFNRRGLEKISLPGLSLNRMWYVDVEDEDLKKYSPDAVISGALEQSFQGEDGPELQKANGDVWSSILDGVLDLLKFRCKHGGFVEEYEWRLLYRRPTIGPALPIEFRARSGMIVPFVKIGEGDNILSLIDWVSIGPMSDLDAFLVKQSLEMIKERYGLNFEISRSGIPFRSLSQRHENS
ncbi:MAG: DUF2971 domain-containing protein [Rhodospirillaceae bacterium]|nr:DUF2971 domain-containing protein [Rhodospirillaceae bacterium]